MFKDHHSFLKAQQRVIELQDLSKKIELNADDQQELDALMNACQSYADTLDADAQAEYQFMQDFEDRFLESQQR